MKRTWSGGCHCGAVRFEADIDFAATETSRCNCSICRKGRFWKCVVGEADVRVLAGEGTLTEYRFGSGAIRHLFCPRCGIKPFGRGEMPGLGPFVAVNVAVLDMPDEELAALKVKYEDGAHDDWEHAPAVTTYL